MRQSYEFYNQQAQEAAQAAEKATLQNVKDRNLRAEKTWLKLARSARSAEEKRADAVRKQEERRAEEAVGS